METKTLAARNVENLIANYLRMLPGTPHECTEHAPILGSIFTAEMKEIVEVMDAETEFPRDNGPRFMLEWGARFGVRAATIALTCAPQEALERISSLLAEIKAGIREQLDRSHRNQAEALRRAAKAKRAA